ncbi:MAG: aminotransferase class I/II-fold pyridoxal phosphate-dependent enzyme [Clostridiales Family XIII bacterium]|jgi:histidinol-phosphate aminotransferase|nr:aminotransferase class I/II-fold pyridoxal phosphate-dependent enzyme [Clostridiales Family XIII bacterium]
MDCGTWERRLYDGEPYISGEQPDAEVLTKLNSNENPYPPSAAVLAAIAGFDGGQLRLYPRSDGGTLRAALADLHGVPRERVFVGNGSDEVLALAFRACFGGEGGILFPDITYSFYPVWCDFFGIGFETRPLDGAYRINADDYAGEKRGVVIANPNAPTGIGEGEGFIKKIMEASPGCVVIVDEAYADFSEYSAVPLVDRYPNLLVTRTFSKSRSLAGMRIGYAVGSPRTIEALKAAKDSFNSYPIDSVAIAAGVAALGDSGYYSDRIGELKQTRDLSVEKLSRLGFKVLPSQANFIMVSPPAGSAEGLFLHLREKRIFVRYFAGERLKDFLRITIGTPEQMDALISEAEGYVSGGRSAGT